MEKKEFIITRHHLPEDGQYYELKIEAEFAFSKYGFDFYVHKKGWGYGVSEKKTGMCLLDEPSNLKEDAIANASILLDYKGDILTHKAIKKAEAFINKRKFILIQL